MHTIEIPEAGRTFYLPSNLSECTREQYIDMCDIIYRYQSGKLPYEDMRVQAAYRLLNLKPAKEAFQEDVDNKLSNIYQISQLIDNFFEEEQGRKVIKMEYTHNPVPSFAPLWRRYYGPADGFADVTYGEYVDGLRLFLDYSATGDPVLLRLLAAVFYRKKKLFGKREPYNSATLEARADVFKYMPIGFIYGFLLLFASFQKYITGAKIMWAGKEIDLSILFDAGDDNQLEAVPGIGLDSVVFSLAESGEFGDMQGVRNTNLWVVLVRLYDHRKKDLDRKMNEKSTK